MNRKKLLLFVIVPVSAVASLGCGFLIGALFAPAPSAEPNQTTARNAAERLTELGLGAPRTVSSEVEQQSRATQNKLIQDLKEVIRDANARRQEYENKIMDLHMEEERIAKVREAAQEDYQRLDNMRSDIAYTFAHLKKEKQSLEDGKIRVQEEENENLKIMATSLGLMKPSNAATLLFNMSEQTAGLEPGSRPGIDEAALYIFLMDPKKRPKIFDELIKGKNQELAANLMKKVKFIAFER